MKRLITCFLLFYSSVLLAQTLEIEYDFTANLTRLNKYKSRLLADAMVAKFTYQSNQNDEVKWSKDSNSVTLNIADTNRYEIFSNRSDNSIREITRGIKSKDLYQVVDTIAIINWTFTSQTKQIGKYKCLQAVGDFRGRRYEAWYAKELPISFGPFKLHGLPGAILEAYDTKREIMFFATKIKTTGELITFSPPPSKKISRQAYKKEISDRLETLMKNIASKSDRDFELSAKVSAIKSIEMD